MARPLIIIGTGGGAHDVLDVVAAINAVRPTWIIVGFLDDVLPVDSRHLNLPVLGRLADAPSFGRHQFVNAIGSDASFRRRPAVVDSTLLPPSRFATLIHPQSAISARATTGAGVLINYGVSVGGGTCVADHVSIGPGVVVGHDCAIDTYAMLAPGALISGFVNLGRSCYVGAGAMVRQRLAVGEGALVGMGAVVVRSVPANQTVVGNPAGPIKGRRAKTRIDSTPKAHLI
jgi:sugar O-acyltransferase (sialic acid O-acetyltransferase NeuD family)